MSVFAKFGIEHLSPSSLNTWAFDRGGWVLRYLFNVRQEKPKFWRGKAVEIGFGALLHGRPLKEAVALALANFELNAQGEVSDEISTERRLIAPMVQQLEFAVPKDKELIGAQIKIEYYLGDIPIPFLMYLDFKFTSFILELKTSTRSYITPGYRRQAALYSDATEMPVTIICVTDKKRLIHALTEEEKTAALNDVRDLAQSLEESLKDKSAFQILRANTLNDGAELELVAKRREILNGGEVYNWIKQAAAGAV